MGKKLEFLQALTMILIIPILMFGFIHEQRHKSIAESFGCEAEINYIPNLKNNYFMSTKISDCPDSLSNQDVKLMNMMQANVETTGYQLIPVLMLVMMNLILTYPKKKYQERSEAGQYGR